MADDRREARAAAMERMKSGDLDGAIAVLDQALSAASADAGLLMLRGIARVQLGKFEDGVDDLRQAAALSPGDGQIQFNLGNALLKLGEREEASQAYQAAVLADPGYEPPRLALAKLDPAALQRLDDEHLQVDPELPAAQAAPAAPPRPLADDVVYGLDGEPIPNAPGASLAPETPLAPPPGFSRQPSRPSFLPGSLAFVRTWFWIVYFLGVVGMIGYGAFLNFAMKQAQAAVSGELPGYGQPNPPSLENMPPELRQQFEESRRRQREVMSGGEQAMAQAQIKQIMATFITAIVIGLLVSTVLTLLVSKGLGDGTSWGYWLAMVLACLGLLQCPLTIGYIFVILSLTKPESKAWCGVA